MHLRAPRHHEAHEQVGSQPRDHEEAVDANQNHLETKEGRYYLVKDKRVYIHPRLKLETDKLLWQPAFRTKNWILLTAAMKFMTKDFI